MSKIDHFHPDVQHPSSAVPPGAPQPGPRAPASLPALAGAPAAARVSCYSDLIETCFRLARGEV